MLSKNIHILNSDEYIKLYKDMQYKNIYVNYKYIECLESVFNIKLYGIEKEDNIIGIFPIMEKRKLFFKYAPQPPFTQFFNIMIKHNNLKGQKYDDYYEYILSSYILFIKNNFFAFTFPQHYDLKDIRVFYWKGVNVKAFYSYCFDINENNIENIDRRIRNKSNVKYEETEDWELIFNILKKSYSKKMPIIKEHFVEIMKQLNKKKLIKSFIHNNTFITFLIDKENSIIYEYNVGGRDSGILLKSIFYSGQFNGYKFDFQGANNRSIAKYKALFNPELKQYFIISKII